MEYPYVKMDFRGDLDLALPADEQWNVISKNDLTTSFFISFIMFSCF